jgi:hypothetical protein
MAASGNFGRVQGFVLLEDRDNVPFRVASVFPVKFLEQRLYLLSDDKRILRYRGQSMNP